MPTLEISNDEREILLKALKSYISELRMEMADTDSSFFRENLKKERDTLQKIADDLEN